MKLDWSSHGPKARLSVSVGMVSGVLLFSMIPSSFAQEPLDLLLVDVYYPNSIHVKEASLFNYCNQTCETAQNGCTREPLLDIQGTCFAGNSYDITFQKNNDTHVCFEAYNQHSTCTIVNETLTPECEEINQCSNAGIFPRRYTLLEDFCVASSSMEADDYFLPVVSQRHYEATAGTVADCSAETTNTTTVPPPYTFYSIPDLCLEGVAVPLVDGGVGTGSSRMVCNQSNGAFVLKYFQDNQCTVELNSSVQSTFEFPPQVCTVAPWNDGLNVIMPDCRQPAEFYCRDLSPFVSAAPTGSESSTVPPSVGPTKGTATSQFPTRATDFSSEQPTTAPSGSSCFREPGLLLVVLILGVLSLH